MATVEVQSASAALPETEKVASTTVELTETEKVTPAEEEVAAPVTEKAAEEPQETATEATPEEPAAPEAEVPTECETKEVIEEVKPAEEEPPVEPVVSEKAEEVPEEEVAPVATVEETAEIKDSTEETAEIKDSATTCTEYVISMGADNISRSSSTYIGKLRSNFLGTKFIIYDTQPPYTGAPVPPPGRSSRRFYSKKVSPKVPTGSYSIAQVSYELNVLGTRGPRRMHCTMHSIPACSLDAGGTVPGQPELLPRSLEDSFRSISFSKSIDQSVEFSSSRFSSSRFSDIAIARDDDEEDGKERPLILRNKAPRWHEQLQCWCLNFRGRVTVASVKNFQLIAATQPAAGAPTPSQPTPPEHDKIILQFGKVGKDMFTMDYRYPLSAFQAFAICLSSFDTKLACE